LFSNKIEWIGGSTNAGLRRLPISSTCSLVLMLHDTYEDSVESRMIFEEDLDIGFFNSDGFNERLYRERYSYMNRSTSIDTIDLTGDTHGHRIGLIRENNNNDDTNTSPSNTTGNNSRSGNGNSMRGRGGNSGRGSRVGNGGSRREGRGGGNSNTRSGTGGSDRILRSQSRQEAWNVFFPEHIENQLRTAQNRRR
jgi:hypothetical protein